MRKYAILLIILLTVVGMPLSSVNALIPLISCDVINGMTLSAASSLLVLLNNGDHLTAEVSGTFNSLAFQGGTSQSRTTPGSLSYTASSLTPVSVVFDQGSGNGQVAIGCSHSGGNDTPVSPPCANLYDGRINNRQGLDCGAPIAIYLHSIDIFGIDPQTGAGMEIMSINDEILKGPTPESNMLLSEGTNIITGQWIRVYWLVKTGEVEVITAYPDGKPYIVVWPIAHPELLYHLAA